MRKDITKKFLMKYIGGKKQEVLFFLIDKPIEHFLSIEYPICLENMVNTSTISKHINANRYYPQKIDFYVEKSQHESGVNRIKYKSKVSKNIEFEMIYCAIGEFDFSLSSNRKLITKKEKISQAFWMGQTEVTQDLYQEVMGKNPSEWKKQYYQNDYSKYPIEMVSWYDAIVFCNKLSELQGFEKCYEISNEKYITQNDVDDDEYDEHEPKYLKRQLGNIKKAVVKCDTTKNGYRLPTIEEWQYAAKAGTNNQYSGTNNDKFDELDDYAWYCGNSGHETHKVAELLPNEWGFYDMSGNVWEMTNKIDDKNHTFGGGYGLENNLLTYNRRTKDDIDDESGFRLVRTESSARIEQYSFSLQVK